MQSENKLKQREININQRQNAITRRAAELENAQANINAQQQIILHKQEELDKLQSQEREKLETISGLSADEAREHLIASLKDEARTNAQSYINEIVDEAKLNANAQAKKIVIQSQDIAEKADDIVGNVRDMTTVGGLVKHFVNAYTETEVEKNAKPAKAKKKGTKNERAEEKRK